MDATPAYRVQPDCDVSNIGSDCIKSPASKESLVRLVRGVDREIRRQCLRKVAVIVCGSERSLHQDESRSVSNLCQTDLSAIF